MLQLKRQKEVGYQKIETDRRNLVSAAMANDNKWQSHETVAQEVRTKNLVDFALLRNFPAFDEKNPVSTAREHPLSWRLKMFGPPSGATAEDTLSIAPPGAGSGYSLLGSKSFRSPAFPADPSGQNNSKRQQYKGGGDLPIHALASSKVSGF